MPFNIGPGELIIVLIIALIVVGPGKLPDVGAALGKSIREFRKAATDVKESTNLEPAAPASPAAATPTPATPTSVTPAPAAPAAPAGETDPEPVAAANDGPTP
jgi:TatA/E family protein of Tat protein translocase